VTQPGPEPTEESPLAAGRFSEWLDGMEAALRREAESDVPCGTCTACCTSSQFVHIEADEVETLARIHAELQFPAPRMQEGNVLLGYDENGHCPMLVNYKCSIYEHRPRTCRTYDCRVLPAAGVEIDDDAQSAIRDRASRWVFDFPTELDEIEHAAVRAAAEFVREREDLLPDGVTSPRSTHRAVLAIRLHDEFLGNDSETGRVVVVEPDPAKIQGILHDRLGGSPS
jgi:Fe-S-cluster containining protein